MRNLVTLALINLSAAALPAQEPLTARAIANEHSRSVVLLIAEHGERRTAQGTGFAVSPDGLIATTLHVLDGARDLIVRTSAGDSLELVAIRAYDVETDLAVLQVGTDGLDVATLGDSTALRIGDPIIVIGNPLGLTETVTEGILSAVRDPADRDGDHDFDRRLASLPDCELLQISAPVAPGASGSPVFDRRGQVVGVQYGGLEKGALDLNFAIPVEALRPLLDVDLGLDLASLQEMADRDRLRLAERHFRDAELAWELEDLATAAQKVQLALTRFPRYAEALLLAGRLMIVDGQLDRAQEVLERAASIAPDSADVWSSLGALALKRGDLDSTRTREEAGALFRKALEIDPWHGRAHYGAGVVYIAENRLDRALEAMQHAVDADPQFLDAQLAIGEIHLEEQRFEEAEAAFSDALWAESDSARAHFGLAFAYFFLDRNMEEGSHWRAFFDLAEGDPRLTDKLQQAIEFLSKRDPSLIPRHLR